MPTVQTTPAPGLEWRFAISRHSSAVCAAARNASRRERHDQRRARPVVRGLTGEPDHVALDAERAEDDAGRLLHRFEHGSLLDVQLEVRARVDRLQLAVRVEHAVERDAVFRERIHERRPLPILQLAHLVDFQAAGRGGGSEKAPPKARAFFIGPVDELQRHRRLRVRVHAERLERRHHTEAAVEPSAVRHRVEMAADDHGLGRGAGQRHPVVAGRVGVDAQAELGDLGLEPLARVAPHRSPRETLRAIGRRRARRQLAEIINHALHTKYRRRGSHRERPIIIEAEWPEPGARTAVWRQRWLC